MKRFYSLILAAAMASPTTALIAADDPKKPAKPEMTQLLQMRLGGMPLTPAKPTPVDGVYQTKFSSRYAYLIDNGRYAIIGELFDLQAGQNLTELARRDSALAALATVPDDDQAVFPAKGVQKASISVFTDTSCPYCKKLHEEVPKLQDAGITVKYLPFPRGSKRGPGYSTLQQVWCAKDRAEAMSIAKGVEVGELPDAQCEKATLVDSGFVLGNRVGVTGTPAIFTDQGQKIDGYVPYQKLIPMVLGKVSQN